VQYLLGRHPDPLQGQLGSGPSSKVRKIRASVSSLNRPPPTRLDPVSSTNLSIQTSAG
jgi:hypothetical protein